MKTLRKKILKLAPKSANRALGWALTDTVHADVPASDVEDTLLVREQATASHRGVGQGRVQVLQ